MALTKVINDLADLNQSGSTNALKGCAGTTAQQPVSSSTVEYLMVAGGGGGGGWGQAGGGGAGGYVTGSTTVYHETPTVITIGEGGAGGYSNSAVNSIDVVGLNGDDSGFNGLRAIGGGGGGSYNDPLNSTTITYAVDGGSGGGAGTQGQNNNQVSSEYGEGVTGQGHDGGTTYNASGGGYVSPYMAAGGGGAGAPGSGGLNAGTGSGNGGVGIQINDPSGINMISTANAVLAGVGENSSGIWISGGGGGGAFGSLAATGGKGGGGNTTAGQSNGLGADGDNATVNTGGGGGGASGYSNYSSSAGIYYRGGTGGSGLGILKYNNTEVTGYTLNSEDTYTVNWPADKYGIAYWPLNLDVKDVGGHHDGTATDITYVTGKFNQAASFNGSSSKIDVGSSLNNSTFTVSVWFKTSYSGGTQTLINNGGQNSGETGYYLGILASGYYRFGTSASGAGSITIDGTVALNNDVWHHIAVSYTGIGIGTSTYNIYVDGVEVSSGSNGTFTGTATRPTWIGQFSYTPAAYDLMNGEIEQIRFYASALSSSDIQDIYNNSKPGSLPPLKTSSDLTTESLSFPSGATTTALWDFNGDSVADPITYNGTDSNITYVNGKFGECAEFNGTNSSITVSSTLPFSSSFSISMWLNPTVLGSSGTYYLPFMSNGYPSNVGGTGIAWYINGTALDIWIGKVPAGSGTYYQIFNTGTLSTGIWQHLVLTRVYNSKWELYLNGLSLGTYNTQGLTDDFSDTSFYFGAGVSFSSPSYFYNGKIDQTRIFSSALTAQQVYDLWQKENDIQTYFPDTPTSGTDTLVFKEGSGEITFKNDMPPGAEIGMLRYNSTLGKMEHFNSGGWKDFTNCTTSVCNYPITAAALYQFNNNANDTCGNVNGITTDITYTTGKFNQAASFNGSSSYIQINSTFNFSSDFAVSMWFNTDTVATANQALFATDGYDSGTGIALYVSLATITLWNSGSKIIDAQGSVTAGVWNHIVISRTYNSKWELYLNGTLIYTETSTSLTSNFTPTALCYIGRTGPYPNYFDGSIDQTRIFTNALTSAQVAQLYNEVYCP